jgi:MFS family permease
VEERRRAVSMAAQGILVTLPAILAPPIGGALILWFGLVRGVRFSLFTTVVLTLVAVWIQRRHYRIANPSANPNRRPPAPLKRRTCPRYGSARRVTLAPRPAHLPTR